MRYSLLFFFLGSFVSLFAQIEYETTIELPLYQEMSVESAAIVDIPKGSLVVIENSFFGEHGWWEVSYSGERGWVEKQYLNRTKKTFTTENRDCNTNKVKYYVVQSAELYVEMSNESAVLISVPINQAVFIENSFFGEHGWWEVCFNGSTGWIEKKYLSKKMK